MKRQGRLLYVLVTAVVVVALALWLWEPPDRRIVDGDVVVWQVELDEVQTFELALGEQNIVIQRSGERWTLAEPVTGPADVSEVEYLLANLVRLRGARPLPDADPAEFGLAPPHATATLTTGEGRWSLGLGDETPTGDRSYALTEDGTVVVLSNSVLDVVEAELDALRERRILLFPAAEIRRVALTTPIGELEVTGSGTDWFVTGFGRANTLKVEDLIFSLQSTRLLSFTPDTAPDGLGAPTAVARVFSADDEWSFELGEQTPMGTFARRPDGFAGFVDPQSVAYIAQGPLDLLQRRPFRLDPEVDDTVTWTKGSAVVTLTREGETWSGSGVTDALISAISTAEAVYRQDAVPAPTTERARVRVERASGRVTEVVLYQDDGDTVIAQDVAGGAPFRMRGVQALL